MFDLEEILKNTLKKKAKVKKSSNIEKKLEEFLPGSYIDKEKNVFLVEFRYTLPLKHGNYLLKHFDIPEIVCKWAGIDKPILLTDLIFYETETTGLSGGTGTWVFLAGIGRFTNSEFILNQFFMADPVCEEAYLLAIKKKFSDPVIPVSFNGRSYDANLLNTRCIINDILPFLADKPDIDLLYLARRFWKRNLGKCNLNHLEERLLGLSRDSEDDLPSEDIPQLYFEFLDSGNDWILKNVFSHNRVDILSLPVLFSIISEALNNKSDVQADKAGIGRLFHEYGNIIKAEENFRIGINGKEASICRKHLSFLYKKQGRISEAKELWIQAADTEIYAHVELAKLAEHNEKNFIQALKWTDCALDLCWKNDYTSGKIIAALQKRKKRLLRKIERSRKK